MIVDDALLIAPNANSDGVESYLGAYLALDNVLDMHVEVPCEIIDGVRLVRPDADRLRKTRDAYVAYGFDAGLNKLSSRFEYRRKATSSTSYSYEPLPPEHWRYLGIEVDFRCFAQARMSALTHALQLDEPALEFSVGFWTIDFGSGPDEGITIDTVQRGRFSGIPVPADVDADVVARWRRTFDALVALDTATYEGIARSIYLYCLRRRFQLPYGLELLGLFSVLEMLLTHKPKLAEQDSLTHQISTKIPLLSARMSEALDYSCFATHVSDAKIWKQLYSLRSDIAHGEHVDFAKHFPALVDHETATSFVRNAVRRLLRFSLDEPALITALKKV
jgi:hypothetical protein